MIRQHAGRENRGVGMMADGGKATGERSVTEKPETKSVNDTAAAAPENPKDVFRRLGCFIVTESRDKKAQNISGHGSMRPGREPQTDAEFKAIYGADRWGVLPLKDSSLVILDRDAKKLPRNVETALAGLWNRQRRKYVGTGKNETAIDSRHGFLHVTDADHKWCAGFARKYHGRVPGVEVFAEKHVVIYEGRYNGKDGGMATAWHGASGAGHEGDAVITITKRQLEDIFGRLAGAEPAAAAAATRPAPGTAAGSSMPSRHHELLSMTDGIPAGVRNDWMFAKASDLCKNAGGRIDEADAARWVLEAARRCGMQGVAEFESGAGAEELMATVRSAMESYDAAKAGRGGGGGENSGAGVLGMMLAKIIGAGGALAMAAKRAAKVAAAGGEVDPGERAAEIDRMAAEISESCGGAEEHGVPMDWIKDMIAKAADMQRNGADLLTAYLKMRGLKFAHVSDDDRDHFNCHTWVEEEEGVYKWTPAADYIILREMEMLPEDCSITLSARNATEVAQLLSADADTQRVSFGTAYRAWRNSVMIDPRGRYYDIKTGDMHDVDPSRMYYDNADLAVPLPESVWDADDTGWRLFCEFLRERFGDDMWENVRDHIATIFLPGNMMPHKPKMLEIVGWRNTWKSTLIELVAGLLNPHERCNVSMKRMDADSVFGEASIINRLLNVSEETSPSMPRNQDQLKDLITKQSGSARQMRSLRPLTGYRWPRWIIAANKMQPIGENDEDRSIFIRMIIAETKPNPEKQRDWRRDLWAEGVRESILAGLLRRATEICGDPRTMRTQNTKDAEAAYERLRIGDVEAYIGRELELLPDAEADQTGVALTPTWHRFKRAMKTNITLREFRNRLEEAGFEITDRSFRCEPVIDGSLHTYTASVNRDVAQQRVLILGLRFVRRSGQETLWKQWKQKEQRQKA